MQDDNPYAKIDNIFKEIARLNKKPTSPKEPTDPKIVELIEDGMRIVEQLDPIVRETFRDRPAELAEWDSIMHMCDDIEEPETAKTVEHLPIDLEDEGCH
ncbi:MAG: hypothetical protein H7Z16_19240 [Pyrinomonadaceae bacterium]|nr:hypothetical protein [Pyrinomonadaceae bacterium]